MGDEGRDGVPGRLPEQDQGSDRGCSGAEKERAGDNLIGLLRLARKTFASSPEEALYIAVDGKEAREAWIRF